MRCAEPMRHLGAVDIAPFSAVLAQQPEALWSADLAFQKALAPRRDTQTIYLLMTQGSVHAEKRRMAGWEPLHEAFAPVCDQMIRFFRPGGEVLNAQIALLNPGSSIPRHFDRGPVLEACHRIHVPLETHEEVVFEVDGDNVSLAVGQAYELDNIRWHSVFNASPVRRIHLIVDYYDQDVSPAAVA